jgi:sterol desaturase/sphingolipid hydroxylase (fatty acid hydroxylase superfamily)
MNPASNIENFVLQHGALIRMGCFFGVFFIMLVWELVAPRRLLSVSKMLRWSSNLGLLLVNSVVIRLLFPVAAVGMALNTSEMGWGLFNLLELPFWFEVFAAVILLDLLIYGQHVLMHLVPVLWRLHRVHHADLDFDLTTGSRFHTIEIILSMLLKFLAILILGPAVVAVLIFEVVLNVMAMFNHGNVSLPKSVDKVVRRLFVTPDMHRVHHSIILPETNSNYGFNLSIWDRLFKTYIDQPRQGHDAMTIGIPEFRDAAQVDKLPGMLMLPFVNK